MAYDALVTTPGKKSVHVVTSPHSVDNACAILNII